MKKLLLSMAAVTLMGSTAMAAEVTFDFKTSTYGIEGQIAGSSDNTTYFSEGVMTNGDVTLSLKKTTETGNGFRFWSDGLRVFKTGTETISVTAKDANVKSIALVVAKKNGTVKVNGEELNYQTSTKTYTWDGDVEELVITIASTDNYALTSMTVEYDAPANPELKAANLSFDESLITTFLGDTSFKTPTLTKDTDATAVFTSSDENVAEVNATTGEVTIKAVGQTTITATTEANAEYNAGTASYTLVVVNNATSIADLSEEAAYLMNFEAVVAYQSLPYTWITDEEGDFMLIYGTVPEYATGAVIPMGWEGKYTIFKGLPEVTPTVAPAEATEVKTFIPAEVTSVSLDNLNEIVVLKGVDFAEATSSEKASFTGKVGETEYTFYNQLQTPGVEAGKYDVKCAVTTYDALQLYPIAYTVSENTGVENIAAENGEAQYFNLQGVRVANPENGLYIRVQNGKAVKVLVK